MEGFSLWHWIVVIGFIALIAVPTVRIVRRSGRSGWWAILAFLPWVNLVALWVFAYVRWPAVDRGPQ